MNPVLSRRVARAIGLLPPGTITLAQRDELARTVDQAGTFDDLPAWIRELVEQGEAIAQTRESAASSTFADRVSDGQMTVRPGDVSTSPEAMRVLRDRGVDAWRRWVAGRRPPAG